ncbi:MAG: ribonuclease H family protein [Anaerolineales bacterium]|nr:ribonuclease H family protein [Anaerolineales bacterium]MCX7609510.1 ribonuclease H family protein [Anaerolineales bacterium]MDW8227757.1 ribonuclease H family protein [Anaerolineales bacterium]
MNKAPQKFYVVWRGRQTGVFSNWESCQAAVNGYPNARFKAFPNLALAESAWRAGPPDEPNTRAHKQPWLLAPQPPIADSLVVDAACSGNPGPVEWRGVHLASGKQVFHQGPFENGTNNLGEFLAIVHALAWLDKQGLNWPVYSDSEIALEWVKQGHCRSHLPQEQIGAALRELIRRAETWLSDHPSHAPTFPWDSQAWGENPADFGRK